MTKYLHISQARAMLDSGEPVTLVYCKQNGAVITAENVVSLRYDFYTGMRTIKFLRNGQIRSIHDCLILGINDFEVFL
ncbi:MAG: hypothetical protein ACI4AK_09385 [Lepagella sp.]